MNWLEQNDFMRRVDNPFPKIPSSEVLERGIKGLTKQIKSERDPDKKERLSFIRSEFQFLLDNL